MTFTILKPKFSQNVHLKMTYRAASSESLYFALARNVQHRYKSCDVTMGNTAASFRGAPHQTFVTIWTLSLKPLKPLKPCF